MRYRILGLVVLGGLAALPGLRGAAPPAGEDDLEQALELAQAAPAGGSTPSSVTLEVPADAPGEVTAQSPVTAAPPPPAAAASAARAGGITTVTTGPATSSLCQAVALPRPLRADPLPILAPLGRVETVDSTQTYDDGTFEKFTDDYLYSPDGEFKIGTRREWGSTVVFFGHAGDEPGMNNSNTIDANDTGRELQVALYDPDRAQQGCAWDASCVEAPQRGCGTSITHLGWNPVQGGDECNRGSETENTILLPGRLKATLVPRFWNPDWEFEDCRNVLCARPVELPNHSDVRYRQRLRFVDSHAVEIFMEYTNLSNVERAPAIQEFPTLYSSFGKVGPDLWKVMDSEGRRIRVDEPSNDGFFRKRFDSPGGFAALQSDDLGYGVGLYYESRQSTFQAWQRRGQFNNFRARFEFGLPARGKVRGRAYLLIGNYKTIAGTARQLDRRIGPFGELDFPRPDAAVGNRLTLSGWALDNHDVTDIEVRIDGAPVANTPLTEKRPDTCTLWPGYDMCKRAVGFVVELDLSRVSRCAHLLEVRARDTHGNSRLIARQRIFVPDKPSCQGGDCSSNATHPIYRFSWANGSDRDTRFGRANVVPPDYAADGQKFRLYSNPGDKRVPLWQTWCAACTDHLQTFNADEGAPLYTGGELLGYCSRVPTEQASRELRRLNSVDASDHFVSVDPAEVASAAAEGYAPEGRCWVP